MIAVATTRIAERPRGFAHACGRLVVCARAGSEQSRGEKLARVRLARGGEDAAVGFVVELLLVKRRGIERIVQLRDLAEADLDEMGLAFAPVGFDRMRDGRAAAPPLVTIP